MDTLQVIWLAIIQGFTEFLPISSSAHLILPSELLGWDDQGLAFDVAVHVGSLVAVMSYFRRDIWQLGHGWLCNLKGAAPTPESRLAWHIIVATIPAGLTGLLFADFIELHFRSIGVIAATTILFGLLLGWADRNFEHRRTLDQASWRSALMVGLAQALALIPGTSRSGITITAGLMLGFDRESAARLSFLMSIPIIVLSGGYKTLQLSQLEQVQWSPILLGAALSAVTAYLCIKLFLTFIDRIGMLPFVIYRMLLGAALIAVMIW